MIFSDYYIDVHFKMFLINQNTTYCSFKNILIIWQDIKSQHYTLSELMIAKTIIIISGKNHGILLLSTFFLVVESCLKLWFYGLFN